jgi:DNA-binding phage protein
MFSPSFDLTKGGMGKEHEMTVNKNGNPGLEDIYQVAKAVGLDEAWFKAEAQRIQNVVQDELKEYLS